MHRIQTVCLGHKEKLTGNYQTIEELKEQVFEKYRKYLIKKNVKETSVSFILSYEDETTGTEKLLEDMNVINKNDGQWFQLSVKRIWDACCVCLSPFGITPAQLPCECEKKDCGYQYCRECVLSMRKLNNKDKLFYCIYCGNSSPEGPKENRLLIDLLWEQYAVKYNVQLLSESNIMPGTLSNDISCRMIHIKSLIQTLKGKLTDVIFESESMILEIASGNTLVEELTKLKDITDRLLSTNSDDILNDDNDDDKLNYYFVFYINQLTGYRDNSRKCERFISLCEQLLYYIQQSEFEKYFPLLNKKMSQWEDLLNTNNEFQPKIIDVFRTVENDLNRNIIPSIPCRIGFIGEISVGKTSLSNRLRGIEDDYNENSQTTADSDVIFASPIRVGKSTYCKLEFEHQYDNGNKIVFVDIEGSTDTDSKLKSGNYFDEIRKADCDLYIIVFDHQFTDVHYTWQNYIVNELHRTCWIVRSKVDELFLNMFKEDVGQDFDSSNELTKTRYVDKVIKRIRQSVSFDIHGKRLSEVYLTFTSYDETNRTENLSRMPFSKFDLEKLMNNIQNLPISFHQNRLQQMAVSAIARMINTCFRRGYVINVMKYKIAAGITAVIPLLDLIPRYYGREEIRQVFGVNTRSRFMNWLTGRTDEFKDYLEGFNINMDKSGFKTSAFNKTCPKNAAKIQDKTKNISSVAVKSATSIATAGVSVSDDVIRAAGFGAVNAVRGLSATLLVAGAVLTVGTCAWSAVSNGKQMYDYLNRLCDDLIIVSQYVTMSIIEDNNETRDLFLDENN